VTENEYAMTL